MPRRRPPRPAAKPLPFRPRLEILDAREVPAALAWDGGGGDGLWSNPLNWSADRLPAAGDDVTIDAPGDVTVTFADGTTAVNSLTVNGDTLRVTGGSLSAGSWRVQEGAALDYQSGSVGGIVGVTNARLNLADSQPAEFVLRGSSKLSGAVGAGQVVRLIEGVTTQGAVSVAGRLVVGDGLTPGFSRVEIDPAAALTVEAGGRLEFAPAATPGDRRELSGRVVNRGTTVVAYNRVEHAGEFVQEAGALTVLPGTRFSSRGRFESAGGTLSGTVTIDTNVFFASDLELRGGSGGEYEIRGSGKLSGAVGTGQVVRVTGGATTVGPVSVSGTLLVGDGTTAGFIRMDIDPSAALTVESGGRLEFVRADAPGDRRELSGRVVNRGTTIVGYNRVEHYGRFEQEAGTLTVTDGTVYANRGNFRAAGGTVSGTVVVDNPVPAQGGLELRGASGGEYEIRGGSGNQAVRLAGTVAADQAVRVVPSGAISAVEDVAVRGRFRFEDIGPGGAGSVEVAAGKTFTVEAGGRLDVGTAAGGIWYFSGRFVNRGAVTVHDDVRVSGQFFQEGGTLTVADSNPFEVTSFGSPSRGLFRMTGGDVFGQVRLKDAQLDLQSDGRGRFLLGGSHISFNGTSFLSGVVAPRQEVALFDTVRVEVGDLINRGTIRFENGQTTLHVPNGSIRNETSGRIQTTVATDPNFANITARTLDNRGHIALGGTRVDLTGIPDGESGPANQNSGFIGLGRKAEFRYFQQPFVNLHDGVITGVGTAEFPGITPDGGIGSGGGGGVAPPPVFTNFGLLDNVLPNRLGLGTPTSNEAGVFGALPVVSDVAREPFRLRVTYGTNGVGMNEQWVRNPDNYEVTTLGGRRLTPSAVPFDPNIDTIWLQFPDTLPDEPLVLRINSSTVYDNNSVRLHDADYVFHFDRDPFYTPPPPTAPTVDLDLQPGSDTGPSDADNITADDTPTFDVAVNLPGRIELDVTGDGAPDRIVTAAGAGVYAIESPPLADGLRRVTARFVPDNGTAPVSAGLDLTIGAAPVAVTLALNPVSDTGTAGDGVTADRRPKFDVTVDRPGHLDLDVDGDGTFDIPLTVPAGGTFTFTPPADLAAGPRTVRVRFQAQSGGTATATLDVSIDTAPPALSSFAVQGGAEQRSTVNRTNWTFSEPVNVPALLANPADLARAFRLSRYTPANGWEEVSLSPDQFRYDPATRTLTWNLPAGGSLADGFYQWQVYTTYLRDAAGNPLAGGSVLTQTFHRLQGDFNGDRVVDAADLALINKPEVATPGQPSWDPALDLDGDGKVTARDRKLVAGFVRDGRRVTPPPAR